MLKSQCLRRLLGIVAQDTLNMQPAALSLVMYFSTFELSAQEYIQHAEEFFYLFLLYSCLFCHVRLLLMT